MRSLLGGKDLTGRFSFSGQDSGIRDQESVGHGRLLYLRLPDTGFLLVFFERSLATWPLAPYHPVQIRTPERPHRRSAGFARGSWPSEPTIPGRLPAGGLPPPQTAESVTACPSWLLVWLTDQSPGAFPAHAKQSRKSIWPRHTAAASADRRRYGSRRAAASDGRHSTWPSCGGAFPGKARASFSRPRSRYTAARFPT